MQHRSSNRHATERVPPCVGRGRLSGRAAGRIFKVSHADEVDRSVAQFFINSSRPSFSSAGTSSLSLMFLMVLKSLVLPSPGGMRSGCDAMLCVGRLPRDQCLNLYRFFRWVFDTLEQLNEVVRIRHDSALSSWARWIPKDFNSRPCRCLRPDYVPPSPYLVVAHPPTHASTILKHPSLIVAEFRNNLDASLSGHPVVGVDQFLHFVEELLPQGSFLELPRITGRDLFDVAQAKMPNAGGLDGWPGMSLRPFHLTDSLPGRFFFNMVENTAVGRQGLLDADKAMIPKVDGDATPSGQNALFIDSGLL